MRFAVIVLISGACSSESLLTGNPEEDLATLTASVESDCNHEALCGPVPHCLRDGLRDGQVATIQVEAETIVTGTGTFETYPRHLFTLDGSIIQIDDRRGKTEEPYVYEQRCAQLVIAARGADCWEWEALQCDSL